MYSRYMPLKFHISSDKLPKVLCDGPTMYIKMSELQLTLLGNLFQDDSSKILHYRPAVRCKIPDCDLWSKKNSLSKKPQEPVIKICFL